ncbi:GNAT family N-acetyltransferase [Spirosoma jeollabukense]
MSKHILDNPAWNALVSGNKHLSNGNDIAKYFAPDVSPFVGIRENTQQNLEVLYQTIPFDNPVILIANEELMISSPWRVLTRIDGFQMVYSGLTETLPTGPEIIPLTNQHVPQMLALTQLTNPGPFAPKTIDFGHYRGIFDGDQLIAMAGQRLHAVDFAEISAVCTHPDHLGKGYARMLLLHQLHRIQAASGTPYLHVKSDNVRAVNVYKALGFETRTDIYFYVLQKA